MDEEKRSFMDMLMGMMASTNTSFTPSTGTISDAVGGVPGEIANLWNTPVVQSDNPGPIPRGFDTLVGGASRAFQDTASGWPWTVDTVGPKLAAMMAGAITDPTQKYVNNEDVTVGDLSVAGLTAAPYVGPLTRLAPKLASTAIDAAGTATMGGAKVAQNLTGANIVPTVAKAIGPHRLSMGRWWLPQYNTRKDSTAGKKFQAEFEALPVQGRGGWYGGVANKLNHLDEMFQRAGTGQGVDSPLLMDNEMQSYLTSLGDDLLQVSQPSLVTGGHSVTGQVMRPAGSDALVAQVLQTADTAMRYFPDHPESIRLNRIVDEVLRNKVNTTVSKMSTEPSVIREVLSDGLGPDMTDDVLSKHLIPFIKTDLNLTKTQPHKNVRIASKPFYSPNPIRESGKKGYGVNPDTGIPNIEPTSGLWDWNGRLPLLREVQMLVNGGINDKEEIIKILLKRNDAIKKAYLARTEPIPTMKNQLKGLVGDTVKAKALKILEKYEKTRVGGSTISKGIMDAGRKVVDNPSLRKTLAFLKKAYNKIPDLDQARALNERLYDEHTLRNLIVDEGDHISVSQWVLGQDTLLATYPTRMILNKNDGTGAFVLYDQMAPGVPIPGMQGLGNIGSDTHSLYMDIIPVSKTDLKGEANIFGLSAEGAFNIPKRQGSPAHQTGEFQSIYPKLRENLLGL